MIEYLTAMGVALPIVALFGMMGVVSSRQEPTLPWFMAGVVAASAVLAACWVAGN